MSKTYKTRVDKGVRRSSYVSVLCPCGKQFEVQPSRAGRKKYCSLDCKRAYAIRPSGLTYNLVKDNPTTIKPGQRLSPETEFKPGQKPWNDGVTGTHFSPATEFKPGDNMGSENPRWKGDEVEYFGLHQRLYGKYGRAAEYACVYADQTCKGPMNWANISGEYLGVEDFMPLCRSHHIRYDRANGFWGSSPATTRK